MSVKKARIDRPFVIITNDTARNKLLSLEAKGLIMVMGSRPDDWIFYKKALREECGIGREKLDRLFKELVDNGYLELSQSREKGGRFSENDYLFYIDPACNETYINKGVQPCTENPSPVNSMPVSRPLQRKTLTNKDKTNTKRPCATEIAPIENKPSNAELAFDKTWEAWHNKKNRIEGKKVFTKLCKDNPTTEPSFIADSLIADFTERLTLGIQGFDKIHFKTYINGKRWEDDKTVASPQSQNKRVDPVLKAMGLA